MRKYLIGIILVLGILGAALWFERGALGDYVRDAGQTDLPEAVSFAEAQEEREEKAEMAERDEAVEQKETTDVPDEVPSSPPVLQNDGKLPVAFNLAVPFTPQAPYANWELPYQEACEEASLLMVHAFYEGRPAGLIDPATADAEILKLVEFQEGLFGYYADTTADQTGHVAEQFYGYGRVEVVSHPSIEDIKGYVFRGLPVIVPAAGRELGNPYFTQPGPLYHMLVIRGWTANGFITNDPGTRRGEGHVYSYATLMAALHDWNGGQVDDGVPMAIIIHPEDDR